jgi:hypothetical protein
LRITAAIATTRLSGLAAAPGHVAQLLAEGIVGCRFPAEQLGAQLPLLKYGATSAAPNFAQGLQLVCRARATDDATRRRVQLMLELRCDAAAVATLRGVRLRAMLPPMYAAAAVGTAAQCQSQPSGAVFDSAQRTVSWTLPTLPESGTLALKAQVAFELAAGAPPLVSGAAPIAVSTAIELECSGSEARALFVSSGVGVALALGPKAGPVLSRTLTHRMRVRVQTRVA